MPNYRCQIAHRTAGALSVDDIVNTIYLRDGGATTDPANLASSLTQAFATRGSRPTAQDQIECRIYDLAHAEPREPVATHVRTQAGTGGAGGPREVALCLSFYSDRNIKRQRGRIYIGPWASSAMIERPSSGIQAHLTTLAAAIANVGGTDVDWCVYSPTIDETQSTDAAMQAVSNSWIDNEWDTVRSRGLEATSRVTATHDEDPP